MKNRTGFTDPAPAWRSHVTERLKAELPGQNLYDLARHFGVTVRLQGRLNKGWVGQTLEHAAHLDGGSAQRRDGLDFELKSTSLEPAPTGWKPKETIRITQLSPLTMLDEEFETSALWNKLASLILVGCHHESDEVCRVVAVNPFDLSDPRLIDPIRSFWEEVQVRLTMGEIANYTSSRGTSEGLIQLRGTGDGKTWSTCPVTGRRFLARAFYATKPLVREILAV